MVMISSQPRSRKKLVLPAFVTSCPSLLAEAACVPLIYLTLEDGLRIFTHTHDQFRRTLSSFHARVVVFIVGDTAL